MAMDRHAKLENKTRDAFRRHLLDQLSSGKQRAQLVPGFAIPRSETVDLFLGPKDGTTLVLVHRFDYLTVYRHTVGQLAGILAHYPAMSEQDLRRALGDARDRGAPEEEKPVEIDALKVSRRLIADRDGGKLTLAVATELPDVPQQARELSASFLPVAALLRVWFSVEVERRKPCKGLDLYAVNLGADPPTVAPLEKALRPLSKLS